MKYLNFLCLIALFTISRAHKLCRRTKTFFTSNTFIYSQPIASQTLASRYLQYPQIIPLLFANFITNYDKSTTYSCVLTRPHGHKIVLVYSKKSTPVLTIVNHHPKAFPVNLVRTKYLVYVTKKTSYKPALLHIRFIGPPIRGYRYLRARNIYARAFVNTLLDNARLVLGLGSCSSSLSSVSGLCNNPFYPHFGVTFVKQLRPWTGPTLKLSSNLPNPRYISNVLCKATAQHATNNNVNLLMVMFGQFLDHDLVLTPSGESSKRQASFDLPPGDVRNAKMHFTRSDPLPYSPSKCCNQPYTPASGEWNQFNKITSFVDASAIYGSEHDRAMALRSFRHGKLIMIRTKQGEFLPRNNYRDLAFRVPNANDVSSQKLFVSGDIRANENPVLLALHTIFAREHNRICDQLQKALRARRQKAQSDEWLYQMARKIVIGQLQNIVFNEFVPFMIGKNALGRYSGYKPRVDASIDIMFATAAYRWGHSALRNFFMTRSLKNEKKRFDLHLLFFNPDAFRKSYIEDWLLGAMDVEAARVDLEHADAVRDFLFSKIRGVRDLAAINIARGRDHGLPGYLAARQAYGLAVSGEGLGDIPGYVRTKLMNVYKSLQDIDPFVGGLAEEPAGDALVGPFFRAVLTDQFRRLRDGDRFYYENVNWGKFVGSLKVVKKIKSGKVRLMDVIKANTKIDDVHVQGRKSVFQNS